MKQTLGWLIVGIVLGLGMTAVLSFAQVVPINFFGLQGTTLRTVLSGYSLGEPMATPQFTASSTVSTSTLGSLASGTTYYFELESTDGVGTTTASNEISFTTPTTTTTSSISLQWNGVPGTSKYILFFATSSAAENYFTSTTATSFTVSSTAQFPASTSVSTYTSAYASLLNASGTSQALTGSFKIGGLIIDDTSGTQGFVVQGKATTTCYLETFTSTGTLTAATTTCL